MSNSTKTRQAEASTEPSLAKKPTDRQEDARARARAIFDETHYLRQRPDVGEAELDPFAHYLEDGWREGVDPHPLFDEVFYRRCAFANGRQPIPGLLDYAERGAGAGLWPNPAFDPEFYVRFNALKISPEDALVHYSDEGGARRLIPHPLFRPAMADKASGVRTKASAPVGYGELADALELRKREGRAWVDPAAGLGARLAAVVHVYYPELWEELRADLDNLPPATALYITAPADNPALLQAITHDRPDARLTPTLNRGRDIGPFLLVLPELIAGRYDAVCKLHTKKGITEPETWSYMMRRALIGDAERVRQIAAWFQADPDLALVGPDVFWLDGPMFIGGNGAAVEGLASAVYPGRTAERWGFFAGTMFWFRPNLFAPLVEASISFEREEGRNDGEIAHAVERLLGMAASLEGGRVGLIDVTGDSLKPEALTVRRAPHTLSRTELADYLPGRARELALSVEKRVLARRRRWRAPGPGVCFLGPVEAQNGLGVSARGYVEVLKGAAPDLHVVPWRPGFDRVRLVPGAWPAANPDQPINLIHLNLDLMASARLLDVTPLDRMVAADRFSAAICSWELTALRPEWKAVIERFDEIWVASRFTQEAVQAVSRRPVRLVRPTLSQRPVRFGAVDARARLGLPADRFLFAYVADAGSCIERKNPLALWSAYADTFKPDEGAGCVLKLHYAENNQALMEACRAIAGNRPDMRLITASLSDGDMAGLFDAIDAYVSPHRSEGVGLTILEAMQAGKPVIATAYGGAADVVSPDTAWVIEHGLSEVASSLDVYVKGAIWAEPKIESLRAELRRMFDHRDQLQPKIRRAKARVETLFGVGSTRRTMADELRRIWTHAGGAWPCLGRRPL